MPGETSFGLQNIIANDGIGIAITGMSIVFTALTLITMFIATLPKLLGLLANVLPPEQEHHAPREDRAADDEALAVAVGFALRSKSND